MSRDAGLPPETAEAPGHGPGVSGGRFARRALMLLASLLILLMIAVTCTDVFGRYVMNRPFGAAYELTQLLLASLVFVSLPLTTADGGHVEVDLALHLFPDWLQTLLARLAGAVSAAVLAYFAWRLVQLGHVQVEDGTRTAALGLPMAPLAFVAAASCAASALIMLVRRA